MGKKLLYFENSSRSSQCYMGYPIYIFKFRDVETGQEVILRQCILNKDIKDAEYSGKYYSDIEEALDDYDILWYLTELKIESIKESFEEVQAEYRRLLEAGEVAKDINSHMTSTYNQKGKTI